MGVRDFGNYVLNDFGYEFLFDFVIHAFMDRIGGGERGAKIEQCRDAKDCDWR